MEKPAVRLKYLGRRASEWARTNGKFHLVDCTALLAESIPITTAFELGTGMEEGNSINSKYAVATTAYLGLGTAFARGNFLSRKLFGITKETPRWQTSVHDIAYTAAFNVVVAPAIYLASGERDLRQLVLTSGTITAVLTANRFLAMGAVEWARDLTGLEPCKRKIIPDLLRRRKPKTKKVIAAGLLAALVGSVVGMYRFHEDEPKMQDENLTQVAHVIQADERDQGGLLEQTLFE